MLREKIYLLFIIFMLPFYAWLNYLLAFLLFIYLMLDKYVNYVISTPDYISCEVELEETDMDNVQFTLHSKKEYNYAIESKYCILRESKSLKYFYKGFKTIVHPVDQLYKKSEKIYLPYLVNKSDQFLWYVYCAIFNCVRNLPPIKKLTNKMTGYLIGFAAKRAITMMSQIKKTHMSSKDKKNVTTALDMMAGGKEIDVMRLRQTVEMLMNKIKNGKKEL